MLLDRDIKFQYWIFQYDVRMALSLKNVRVAISCKKREFVVHSMWHYRCIAERDMLDFVAEPILHPDQNYKNLLPPSSNKNNEECLVKTFWITNQKTFSIWRVSEISAAKYQSSTSKQWKKMIEIISDW